MMRPATCLSLLTALGAGLYLYQEKHTAQLLDRDINRTVKQAEASRDRIGLLKAEWALLNEPERLQGLAAQHLQLQSLAPAQFARLEDLPNRLPAPSATPVNVQPAPVEDAAAAQAHAPAPVAQAAAPSRTTVAQMAPAPAFTPLPAPARPAAVAPVAAPGAPARAPAPPVTVQLAAARPAPKPAVAPAAPGPRVLAAAKPAPEPAAPPAPLPRPFYAPLMPAYAPTPVVVHAPTVQTASAIEQRPAPFVGSALGMARPMLAAPVPVASSYATR